ncbi:MAG: N-acetylmuramoyl-L-alanine amidase [Melioribacteraceae bacterium]|nr:N-acetylmuramoyl-L-alanine amidase [Melioribacteraceae bacterium]
MSPFPELHLDPRCPVTPKAILINISDGITHAQESGRRVVVLDPGHGGVDSGAIGVNGIKEKDIVLEVAKEVDRLNKELFDNEIEFYLTRYNDTLISLGDRTKLARTLQPDIFISIHCNQATR